MDHKGGAVDLLGDRSQGDDRHQDRLAAHPDLRALSRRLRMEMDETLRAEQHAARISAQRRSTLRDRLLLAEDRNERLAIEVVGGTELSGSVIAVGADHVVIGRKGEQWWVALQHIVALRAPAR